MARIAVDLHGGDFGPSITVPASLQFFRANPQHCGVLFGDLQQIRPYLNEPAANIELIDGCILGLDAQKPSRLLRQDGTSGIESAFRALAAKQLDVLVSAEHTGVLMALMTKYGSLHTLVDRPVLVSWLPAVAKPTLMLDLGASFYASHRQLLIYAAIGAGLSAPEGQRPKLALLNVGSELFKGPTELRLAHTALSQWADIDYCGFIEASELFLGQIDVIVCDGFTGNSVIKSAEGAVGLYIQQLEKHIASSVAGRVLGRLISRFLTVGRSLLDPSSANGALLAGSELTVVKSHGNADVNAFLAALNRGAQMSEYNACLSVLSALDRLLDRDLDVV